MKKLSKLLMVAFAVGILALGTYVVAQEVSSQNVVGFVKVPIVNGYNIVSIPMQKVASYTGTIQNNSGNNINVTDTPWSAGQFDWGVMGQEEGDTNSYFYVEITDSGSAFEGRHMYIDSNTSSQLTIRGGMPSDIADDALNGATFKIVAANRVRDVFGDRLTPSEVPLETGSDLVFLFVAGSGWDASFKYTGDGGPPQDRYKYLQGTNEVSAMVIDRDAGLLINHTGSGTNLTVSGEVAANKRTVVFTSGYNVIGGDVVMSELASSTSLTNALNGLAAGSDLIFPWGGDGWDASIKWTGPSGPPSDRHKFLQGTNNVTSSFQFEMTKGYLFNVETNFTWTRDTPLD